MLVFEITLCISSKFCKNCILASPSKIAPFITNYPNFNVRNYIALLIFSGCLNDRWLSCRCRLIVLTASHQGYQPRDKNQCFHGDNWLTAQDYFTCQCAFSTFYSDQIQAYWLGPKRDALLMHYAQTNYRSCMNYPARYVCYRQRSRFILLKPKRKRYFIMCRVWKHQQISSRFFNGGNAPAKSRSKRKGGGK